MNLRRLANRLDGCSRRDLLTTAAQGLLGVSLLPLVPSLAGADPTPGTGGRRPTAKNCIYLYMSGGMSHLDTFDPKPGAESQGPTKVIPTAADGVQVSEHFPLVATHMRHVAVVRSLNSTQGAHEPGQYFMRTSYTQRGTIRHPSMGAWVSHLSGRANPTLPTAVSIGGGRKPGAGFMESRFSPLPIGNPEAGLQDSRRPAGVDGALYQRRLDLLGRFNDGFQAAFDHKPVRAYNDLYDEAVQLMASKDLAAFDIKQEPEHLHDAYGDTPFGHGCLLARRLIEHDVRFVEVELGGWDTHDDNFDRVEAQANILDRSLSALLADLTSRGMLEETLVVVATEFGRTPKINGNTGRDHYPKAFSCLLAGGGIKGGQVHGATDPTGGSVVASKVEIPDFNATIGYALGLPIERVVMSPSGRPFTLADKGRPLTALF